MSANHQSFHFDIDETWKDKLINGLDDIAITLKYEELIEKYENNVRMITNGFKDNGNSY